jgi:hypothetical protein
MPRIGNPSTIFCAEEPKRIKRRSGDGAGTKGRSSGVSLHRISVVDSEMPQFCSSSSNFAGNGQLDGGANVEHYLHGLQEHR